MSAAAINWAGALVLAALLALGTTLDGPEDHAAEWGQSDALKELQAAEASAVRREAAAQRLCNEARGPNSEARWTPEGQLTCTTRRGVRALHALQGAQP